MKIKTGCDKETDKKGSKSYSLSQTCCSSVVQNTNSDLFLRETDSE